uniref:Ubiquitin-like protease family profile domain-containing protein n=1 Tax=Cannabis sativa TaxID=3483 RepID=A0A803QCD9_CANSA
MRSFEEQSETNREEKSESSGQEETELDGEEQEESDGEEQAKLDGEEQAESNGDEQVESYGEEQEESDGEEQLEPSSVSRDKTHARTTWKCKKSPSYSGVVKALDDSKDIKSILSPIKWEKKIPHMQCFIRISESMSNNLIDILTAVLESGGTINWTDDTDRHERCGNVDVRNEEQHVVTNEEQPSGQATKVGNTIHVQPMSETTRDYLRVVTPGYSPIHMSTPSTMYGPEARQSEKVDWCIVKAYIDQQFSLMRLEISLMRSEILLLPSKIITSLQQQNIHVEGQLSPHCERQHTHVEEEHSPHSKRQHTHVEEQYTPYYEEQPLQDDVEGESHLVVRENPKRVPKRSHYLEPPYTDPFHYTKARRVKADIRTLELVYGCSIGATTSKEVDDLMLPLQTMIPIMLRESLQFQEITQCLSNPWTYKRLLDVPQNSMGDCAVYTIKFIEFDMAGLSFESLSDDRMAFYIRKMAVDIFCQQWDP